jgi:ferrous iron transport protein A
MKQMPLSNLAVGQSARVIGYNQQSPHSQDAINRLRELGMVEGATVEMRHRAPFGGDPLAAYVRGTVIGLRKADASLVIVEEIL